MANFLNINGWRVPVTKCEMMPFEIGSRDRSVDGTPMVQRRAVKRKWKVDTSLLSWIDANALWQLVQGRGHQWPFNGSTHPQDTSGTSDTASKGGLILTNSPAYSLESTTAVDGATVKWTHSTTSSASPSVYGSHALFMSPGTTNLYSSDIRNCENAPTGFSAWSTATPSSDTTHKWQGSKSLKVVTDGTNVAEGVVTGNFTTSIGVTYVVSCYVKVTSGTPGLSLYSQTSAGVPINSTNFTTINNTWVRCFISFTATTTSSRVIVATQGTQAITFYCDGFQAEALTTPAYTATAWVDGTRTASGQFTYPTSAVSTYNSHTISLWSRGYSRSGALETIAGWAQTTSANVSVLQYNDGFPRVFISDTASNSTTAQGAARLTPGATWHHIVCVYDAYAATIYLYVNGTQVATSAVNFTPDFSTIQYLLIGGASIGTLEAFGGIDEVIILPFAASNTLVTALYSGLSVAWPALPKLYISGDSIDGTATVIGNTQNGSFARVVRSGAYQKNNMVLSFELEEV